MARTANAVTMLKDEPKQLPDGLEVVEVKRKLKTVKPENASDSWKPTSEVRVLRLIVPKANAEGVTSFVRFYSEHCGNEKQNGPVFVAECVRTMIANAAAAKIALGDEDTSALLIAPVPTLRTVDKAEMAGERLAAWTRDNPGKIPGVEDLKTIYAGIA